MFKEGQFTQIGPIIANDIQKLLSLGKNRAICRAEENFIPAEIGGICRAVHMLGACRPDAIAPNGTRGVEKVGATTAIRLDSCRYVRVPKRILQAIGALTYLLDILDRSSSLGRR